MKTAIFAIVVSLFMVTGLMIFLKDLDKVKNSKLNPNKRIEAVETVLD